MSTKKGYASIFGARYIVFDNFSPEELKSVPDGTRGWWEGNVIELRHGDPETSPFLNTSEIKSDAKAASRAAS